MNNYPVVFTDSASEDFKLAVSRYQKENLELAKSFVCLIEKALSIISQFPDIGKLIFPHVRRTIIRQFKYSIYYFKHPRGIIIIALKHNLQHPEQWRSGLY